jgi:hypothetical protein
LSELAAAVQDNGEVWDAADTPKLLVDFIDRVPAHVQFEAPPWRTLKTFLNERYGDRGNDRFAAVWVTLERRGVH